MKKQATLPDKVRFRKLSELGCIACWKTFGAFVQGEIAHVTHAGRRAGHDATFSLCPVHHRGLLPDGLTQQQCDATFGPSFAKNKHAFEEAFGTEDELLEETNRLLNAPLIPQEPLK